MGWLGDRYGVRRLLFLGALLFILGMMLTGIMTHLWQFYLFFGVVLGVSATMFGVLTISGVTLWFRRNTRESPWASSGRSREWAQ